MSFPRHARISESFLQAVELDPSARKEFLDRACEGDPELRAQIESLLLHDDRYPQELKTGSMVQHAEQVLSAPGSVGPFVLMEKIGEGGMGVVYRAEQRDPIRRQVALKLIKRGLETEQILRRFEAERNVLALMDHPGIAKVLDAGTIEDDRPYFAMEYVRGMPVHQFCDWHGLDIPSRLELFLRICDAVQHAHQNAVIHRDLKPSNVLVTTTDGRPVPKIIDFGIAKALAPGPESAALTEAGQVIGTLEYMSPEQVLFPQGADTRADVYSLGALLYEMLCGSPPFESETPVGTGLVDLRRRVLEVDPSLPSTRVDSTSRARLLRGDLDSITMKALEKDRDRRYGSVSAMAADLRRHLNHEPVEARPTTAAYRLMKYARKHRTAAVIVAALTPVLIGLSVVMTIQTGRIARERDRAEQVSEFLVRFYESPVFTPERHVRPTPEDILLGSAGKIDAALGDRPELQARLTHQMGRTLSAIGRFDEAQALLETAYSMLRELEGSHHPRTLTASYDLALLHAVQEEPGSIAAMLEALDAKRQALGDRHPDALRALSDSGHVLKRSGRYEEAAVLLEEAVAGMNAALGRDHPDTRIATSLLAAVYLDLARLDEAESLLVDLIPRMRHDMGEGCIAVYNLACVYAARGQRDKALANLRRALDCGFIISPRGDPNWSELLDDPELIALAQELDTRQDLGTISRVCQSFIDHGRYEEAAKMVRSVLETARLDEIEASQWKQSLALAYLGLGRYAEAEALIRQRLAVLMRHEPEFGEVYHARYYLLQAQIAAGDVRGAIETLDQQVAMGGRYRWSVAPYPQAQRAAILGDHATALRELYECVRQGAASAYHLQSDLAFRDLRGTPEFEAIVEELRRRTWYP